MALRSRTHRVARPLLALTLFGGLACSRGAVTPSPTAAPEMKPPAPWGAAALAPNAVPPVYRTAWRAAENRSRCALLAPASVTPAQATPRAATFSGGWGVAYDLPGERSTFGIAGTGASAWAGDIYDAWPVKRELADGSRVGYGPEGGGASAKWLAYVRIPGQDCLYNVWSWRGRDHLEALLAQLRFVSAG